jgi:hypothetical protein
MREVIILSKVFKMIKKCAECTQASRSLSFSRTLYWQGRNLSKKKLTGDCRICGSNGQMSFEHVPPRAAFNDRRVVKLTFDAAIRLGPDEIAKGPIEQKGMGDYTLCIRCNNNTGSWYGSSFVDWCYQGMEILQRSGGKPTLIYMHYMFPLRILKQIVTMFFSVNQDVFRTKNPELVRFVLNKEAKYLDPKYRFFVYYNTEGRFRFLGGMALLDIHSGRRSLMSEITYPPFGYVMTIDSDPPDGRLVEITSFSRYSYDEFKAAELNLPVLATHTGVPGDYRTKQEIYEQS